MLKDFKKFILRGSVVDLAVAVVVGTAFTAVVTALVKDFMTPLIAAIIGKPDFSNLVFTINKSVFYYGQVINAVVAFLSVSTIVFFFVVQPINKLHARAYRRDSQEPSEKVCSECLSLIPKKATRCKFCTSPQQAQ